MNSLLRPDGTVVGHIPKHASKAVLFFLRKAGSAGLCEVTGSSINHGVGLDWKFRATTSSIDVKLAYIVKL